MSSSPGDSHSGGQFFPTGQGGRPVLPPLSDSFPTSRFPVPTYPTPYSQPRSAPNRLSYDLALYPDYTNSSSSPQFPSAFPNYEIQRFSPQPSYPSYQRSSPPIDSRRLPPLSTSPPPDRWPQQPFLPQSSFPPPTNIRSPLATYPSHNHFIQQHYPQPNAYQFPDLTHFEDVPRSNSPLTASTSLQDRQPTPPPISPSSPEEPTVKKKRRRADANQLKVLNETYARTAFPSTEERIALAKMLDMSARSVQIWFQNKRQAMRQTNRQSNNLQSQQPYSLPSQDDSISDQLLAHPAPVYDTPLNDSLYLPSDPSRHPHHPHAHTHAHGHPHGHSHGPHSQHSHGPHDHSHEHSHAHSHTHTHGHSHHSSHHSSRHRD